MYNKYYDSFKNEVFYQCFGTSVEEWIVTCLLSERICCEEKDIMRFNAPKNVTWYIALLLGVLGVFGTITTIPIVSGIAFWLVVIGLALLLLATAIKNL